MLQRVGEGREGPQGEISVTYLERALSFSSRANVWPNQTPSLEFRHDYVSQMVAAAYNDLQKPDITEVISASRFLPLR